MSESIEIYDSTLRDGAQAEGIAFSLKDKLLIARRLDELGVHYIEGGWPNPTNPKDLAFFEQVGQLGLKAKVTAFGSTRRATNCPEDDATLKTLLMAGTDSIAIFGKSWTLHVEEVLVTTLEENLRLIEDSVAFLVSQNREVVYDAEHFFDGYKSDSAYAVETLLAAQKGGARIVVLCDTNGGTLTTPMGRIISEVKGKIDVPFGIHAHNDAGVGVANSLVAVELGAVQVQGTFNGYGERCGNASLCSIIPNLELKMGKRTLGSDKLQDLVEFSRFLSEIANAYHDHRQPYVGDSAFAHKGGAHVDGVMKVAHSFEHVLPQSVGNARRFLGSDQSGGSTIVSKLRRYLPEINKKDPLVAKLLERVKQLEHEGYQFEAAEGSFELLARRIQGTYEDVFHLVDFRTINRRIGDAAEEAEAIVKVKVNGKIYHTAAGGDGPVNSLDQALRKALEQDYPSIRDVHLEDYKVRVLSSGDGTAGKVRVLIRSSDGSEVWGTVGVSENIIEASWIALADSLHFKLMKDAREAKRGGIGDGRVPF